MLRKLLLFLLVIVVIGLSIWGISNIQVRLFANMPWLLAISIIPGTCLGLVRAIIAIKQGKLYRSWDRHTIDSFLQHWGTAAGIFLLMLSAYRIFTGSAGFFATNLHFLGSFIALFFGCYFLVDFFVLKKYYALLPTVEDIIKGTIGKYFFQMKWREVGKYQSSQKSAFLAFAIIGSEVFLTGAIKLAVFFVNMPIEVLKITSLIHDAAGVFFVLMLLVHVLLVTGVRAHRSLLITWLIGDTSETHPEAG